MQAELLRHKTFKGISHWWLLVNDVAVSYVQTIDSSSSLSDIETRPGYRNHGYGSEILKRVAAEFGLPKLVHDGGYTPDGFSFISSKVTDITTVQGAEFSPMSFVHDWDTLTPMFP